MTHPYDELAAAIRAATRSLGTAADALNRDFRPEDRTTRFLARLDHITSTMSPVGRRHYLYALIDAWERRYARFVCCNGGEMDPIVPADEPDASDYLLTICGISQRLSALEVQREDPNDAHDLEGHGDQGP